MTRILQAAVLLCLAAMAAACGSGTITFGGDDDDPEARVRFEGNLDSVSPVTTRDVVVFVFRVDDGSDRCPCPPDPSSSTTGRAAVLSPGETEFTITGLEPGAMGVVFLLDEPGDSADGEIDPGDPIAILDDIDCRLEDVDGNMTVTLQDVDILFDTSPVADCREGEAGNPAPGRARARLITKVRDPKE